MQSGEGPWPILAVRIPHDVKRVLDALKAQTGGKFQRAHFIRAAIIEKLEREYPIEFLRELGYIKPY
jgi:hypothetical protein